MSARRTAFAERADSAGMQPVASPRRSPVEAMVAPTLGAPTLIQVALIDPHPDNPREDLELDDDFVASVQSMGVMQAITVVTSEAFWASRGVTDSVDAGRYVVLMGHRRRAAAEKAGLGTIPAVIRDDLAGDSAVVVMLIENLHRRDLNALEEARGFARLRELGLDQEAIGRKVGKSQSHISKRLSLLNLPAEVLVDVGTDDLPVGEAQELARYADDPQILKAAIRRASYESVEGVAKRVQHERNQAKAIEAKVAELTAAAPGARFVKWPDGGWHDYQQPGGKVASLTQLRNAGCKVDGHQALDCHALSVGFRYGGGDVQVIDVCSKPRTHVTARDASRSKSEQARKRKKEKARAEAEQHAAKRAELVRARLSGKALVAATEQASAEVMLELLLDVLGGDESIALAAELLGADVPALPDDAGWRERNDRVSAGADALREHAGKNGAGVRRAVAALSLAYAEDRVRYGNRDDTAPPYLRWLESLGHTLSADEKKIAAKAGAR